MKHLRLILGSIGIILVSAIATFAQSRQYFDDEWNETTKSNASYYRITKPDGNVFNVQDFYISGELQFETTSSTGQEPFIKQGYTAWYDIDGDTVDFAVFNNDTLNGPLVSFYTNGKRKEIQHFKMANQHGYFAQLYPWGGVKQHFYMNRSRADGIAESFNLRGILMQKVEFDDGREIGNYAYYHDHGDKYKMGYFNQDQDSGTVETFFENGRLRERYHIKKGYVNGSYVSLSYKGDTSVIAFFVDRRLKHYRQIFDAKGSEFVKTAFLKNGKEEWRVFRDDTLILEGHFLDEHRSGEEGNWKLYTLDGKQQYGTISVNCEDELTITQYEAYEDLRDLKNMFNPNEGFPISQLSCDQKVTRLIDGAKHPFYWSKTVYKDVVTDGPIYRIQEMPKEQSKENLAKGSVDKDSFDYVDPTTREGFLTRNPFEKAQLKGIEYVTFTKKYGDISISFYGSYDKEALVELKESIAPKENEIHFFYNQIESGTYAVSASLQKRFTDFKLHYDLVQVLDFDTKLEIIDLIENFIFSTDDFSGSIAYGQLDRFCDDEKERHKE